MGVRGRYRPSAGVLGIAWLVMAGPIAADGQPASARVGSGPDPVVLDVPYVPQTPQLCGGAAAAMVLRYWGAPAIHAEAFESLVQPERGGIPAHALSAAVRAHGWHTASFRGSVALLRHHLARGRPLIVLLRGAPGLHYVVVTGVFDSHVVFHDPNGAPFELVERSVFERDWEASDRWTLLIWPQPVDAEGATRTTAALHPARDAARPCDRLVGEAVTRIRAGQIEDGERRLEAALAACPGEAGPARELAGLRLRQRRWSEASALADRAARLEPGAAYAWTLLGASRFLAGTPDDALHAWNRIGEPSVDLVQVQGLRRTRYRAVADRLGVTSGAVLTEEALVRARRRLEGLPAIRAGTVRYRPAGDGVVHVDAALVERPRWFDGTVDLLGHGARALVDREAVIRLASPTGAGELWTVAWRWWDERPRTRVSLAQPGFFGWGGIWRADAIWEAQRYDIGPPTGGRTAAVDPVASNRRRASLGVEQWATANLRWSATVGFDHWDGAGRAASAGGWVERRAASDRIALRAGGTAWTGVGRQPGFVTGRADLAWRSASGDPLAPWRASFGVEAVGRVAPLDLWPGAGTGHARATLLRAHPLLRDGVLSGPAIGSRLLGGTIEWTRELMRQGPWRSGVALFADTARAWTPGLDRAAPWHVDVGVGWRVELPGHADIVRIDVARGLRDGQTALSVAWQPAWPGPSF